MSAEVPTYEPEFITAGDTASWKRSLTDYPAGEGWVLSYRFADMTSGAQLAKITGTADGDDHVVNVTGEVTGAWPAGKYWGQGYVTLGTERRQVWEGMLEVRPNLDSDAPAGDQRSHARIVLDKIEPVLEGRAGHDVLESTLEGTVIRRLTIDQLMLLRDRYTVMVQKEERTARIAAGRASGRRILTTFRQPGSLKTWPPGFIR